jgi:peptide subunit release factor 1 (eRF1)
MAAAGEVERGEETKIVQSLRDATARRGGHAVTGLERTLAALTRRDIRTLVIHIGFESPGSVCPNCLALLPPMPLCPHCRARTAPTQDIVEHAIERAEAERAHIEFVEDNTDLMALGHIGAILRFPMETGQ